jgi:hypothetical protein
MQTTIMTATGRHERGAILIHVAIALMGLMAITAFVLDQGVFYLARRQAQNGADAGAHAGAVARLFDETGTPAPGGPTERSATVAAQSNQVFGAVPGVVVEYGCPSFAPEATNGVCVHVETYRDGTHGSTSLPTYFANLWGQTSQDVLAAATAQVRAANYSDCLKPWMIPDRWQENTPPATKYNGADFYDQPTTGWTANDVGTTLVLKPGSPGAAIQPSNYFEIGAAATYQEAIQGCIIRAQIGDAMDSLPGNRVGPTRAGTNALINADPMATVDVHGVVHGSCAPACSAPYTGWPISPRIVPIAMFSPQEYVNLGSPSGNFQLHIVNILAFFIQSVGPPQATVTGVIVGGIGVLKAGPTVGSGTSFLHFITLIQ